jgi:hypothetical protein
MTGRGRRGLECEPAFSFFADCVVYRPCVVGQDIQLFAKLHKFTIPLCWECGFMLACPIPARLRAHPPSPTPADLRHCWRPRFLPGIILRGASCCQSTHGPGSSGHCVVSGPRSVALGRCVAANRGTNRAAGGIPPPPPPSAPNVCAVAACVWSPGAVCACASGVHC